MQRKPGIPRNGAPFADWPELLIALQRALMRSQGGDGVVARVLAAVPTAGLDAVLVAMSLVLETGAVSAEHGLNVLARLSAAPAPEKGGGRPDAQRAANGRCRTLRQPQCRPLRPGGPQCLSHSGARWRS